MKLEKEEIAEAYRNYIDLCIALSQIPTMKGFGKFILDSYN